MNVEIDEVRELFIHPPRWLVFALPWPSDDPAVRIAEAALAVAPRCTTADKVEPNTYDLLGFTQLYGREHPDRRLIMLTDVTRWLDDEESSWAAVGVDFEEAVRDLVESPLLSLYLTISRRQHHHLLAARRGFTLRYPDGTSEQLTEQERETVHTTLERRLDADWPPYIRQMIELVRQPHLADLCR